MSLPSFLYSLASVPMFASRPFLAAAVTALVAKFGAHVPFLRDSDVVVALGRAPEWFTSWPTLLVLVALAVTEATAVKHAEVRAFMEDLDGYLKSAVALLVAFAVLDGDDGETLKAIQRAELGLHSVLSFAVAGLVYATAGLRRGALGVLADVDDDDDIGLQSVLNWVENSWTVLGLLFLLVFPIVAVVLSALTTLGLWWVRRSAERRELRSKVPCASCSTLVLPHASRCHACGTPLAEPRAVSAFGTPKAAPARDPEGHRFDLIARKRCPICATRLKQRAVRQPCPNCATVTFASQAEFEEYLDALQRRLPRTLLICFALSAIPVVGVVPGVVYYRLTLVSGLRGYVPPLRGCLARVAIRVIHFGIIAFQPIPVVGALIVPLMCVSTYAIYRSSLKGRAEKDLSGLEVVPAS